MRFQDEDQQQPQEGGEEQKTEDTPTEGEETTTE